MYNQYPEDDAPNLTNPYLMNLYKSFREEGLTVEHAIEMVHAHVQHGQMAVLDSINKNLEKLTEFTDPVHVLKFMAFVEKGRERRDYNTAENKAKALDRMFTSATATFDTPETD